MRTVVVTILALIGGFFVGIVISEIIGIIGFLLFDSVTGFRFRPVISAVAAVVVALIANRRAPRRSATDDQAVPSDQEPRG